MKEELKFVVAAYIKIIFALCSLAAVVVTICDYLTEIINKLI